MASPARPPASMVAPVNRLSVVRARLNSSWWLLRPFGLLVLFAVMLSATYLGYSRWTKDGTFLREVVVAAIGTVLTIAGSVVVALVAFREQLRRSREAHILRRFDEESLRRGALQVGAMVIPDILVVASCRQGEEWTRHARMEWLPTRQDERPQDEWHRRAYAERIPRLEQRAATESFSLSNDECVDMRSARVELVRDEGRRIPAWVLEPGVSHYYDFLATAADLDKPLAAGDGRSLRDIWGCGVQTLEDVGTLPCPAKVGVGTTVVTKDGRVVLGVRGRTLIAGQRAGKHGRAMVHIVAEGMMPFDLDHERRIDPRRTSLRGLREELLVGADRDCLARVDQHLATGFFFDQLRMQPCFAYLARIDRTWDELAAGAPAAQDFWEVSQLRSLPFDITHVGLRALLLGQHPDMELASNHAAAVLWFACLNEFGYHRMRDALSLPLALPDSVISEGTRVSPAPGTAAG